MSLTHIPKDTLTDRAIREIQQMILRGETKPRDWLPPQPELAARFGVGLSTIREAIKALSLVGVVIAQPGRGTQVSHDALLILNASTLVRSRLEEMNAIKLCEAREIIEVGLSRLAARYADDDDIGRLESALSRMSQAWRDNDDATWAAADLDYHLAIAGAARNDLLAQFYDISREMLSQTAEYLAAMPHAKQRGYELQVDVLDAVRAHDPDAASESANQLMRYLAELIRAPR
jgi:GntR family transcriptional regulator, transcriptional repressor for pyruvate dehydrogenase complex